MAYDNSKIFPGHWGVQHMCVRVCTYILKEVKYGL